MCTVFHKLRNSNVNQIRLPSVTKVHLFHGTLCLKLRKSNLRYHNLFLQENEQICIIFIMKQKTGDFNQISVYLLYFITEFTFLVQFQLNYFEKVLLTSHSIQFKTIEILKFNPCRVTFYFHLYNILKSFLKDRRHLQMRNNARFGNFNELLRHRKNINVSKNVKLNKKHLFYGRQKRIST